MRPKLKSDTFYLPVNDGVYIRNNEKSFVMKGRTIATWIERLAPLLDGNHDLEHICRNVSQEKQKMIVQIVQTLTEQGYAKDVALDQPHSLSPELQETYTHAIAYIDYHTDSGPHRLQKFLNLPVLAIGSGEPLVAMAHALLETGNHCISLLDTGEAATDNARMQEHLNILQAGRDSELTLQQISFNRWHDEEQLQALLAPFGMVLLFSTDGSFTLVNLLTQICKHMALPFLPAIVLDNALHIGPTYLPHTQGCWQCYWRRRQAAKGVHADDEHGTLLFPGQDEHIAELSPPAIAVAANLVAFEFFKQGTGVHDATLENEVSVLELERMQNVKHHLFPHPLCTICAPQPSSRQEEDGEQLADTVSKGVAQLRQHSTTLTPQKLLKQMDQWIDETCGIFTKIDERDLFQLPLIRSKVTIASPQKTDEGLPEREAAGLDYVATHVQAVQEATAFYLDRIAVPRRAYYISHKDREMHRDIPSLHNFSGWTGEPVPDQQKLPHWWGSWLDKACPVLVPMAAVYPHTFWNQHHGKHLFDIDTPGITVGADWFETLARGMQTLIPVLDKGEKASALPSRHTHARIIAQCAYRDDSICASYLKMLAILDHRIELVDITSVSGVPRIGALLDGQCIGLKMHWDAMVAVRESLQTALLNLQIERASDLHHRELKERKREQIDACAAELIIDEQEVTMLPPSLATETQYQKAVQVLQERFKDNGWRLIIVPMLKDRTIDKVLGCTMRILAVQQSDT